MKIAHATYEEASDQSNQHQTVIEISIGNPEAASDETCQHDDFESPETVLNFRSRIRR